MCGVSGCGGGGGTLWSPDDFWNPDRNSFVRSGGKAPGSTDTKGPYKGGPTFTTEGLPYALQEGDTITQEIADIIVKNSNGNLWIENGVIRGKDHDGTGEVYIKIGDALDEGQIHDLHHTVPYSGGEGTDANWSAGHNGH